MIGARVVEAFCETTIARITNGVVDICGPSIHRVEQMLGCPDIMTRIMQQ